MNHSYWLIVIFVATIVCNTSSRPQDFDVKNVYPVYRPPKELDLNNAKSPNPPVTAENSPVVKSPEAVNPSDVQPAKEKPKQGIDSIATVARASSDGPSLSPSVAKVADQLIDTMGQMVDSDTRTPPKLKEIIKEKTNENKKAEEKKEASKDDKVHPANPARTEVIVDKIEANGKFELPDANERPTSLATDSSEGKASHTKKKEEEGIKGVAVPVIMDDLDLEPASPPKKLQKIPEVPKPVKDEKKKNGAAKPNRENPTTTPSSGLSTWILLSDNREATTPSTKKNNKKETTEKIVDDKKRSTTTKKPSKVQTTTVKPVKDDKAKVVVESKQANKKVTNAKPVSTGTKKPDEVPVSALEAMVKNQKKGSSTTAKPKTNEAQKKPASDPKKKISERIDAAETKDKVEIELSDNKKVVTLPPVLLVTTDNPTTVATTDLGNSQTTTENSQESTTKKKKSSSKKKKKNKNRRRKPSNKNETEVELKNAPKNPKQPVGAQLYNFLSREIMPTVGLGLVGVLVTAGLAGLLGYNPFVSGNLPIRRTYESQHGYSPNNYYSYNSEYGDGGQSEEVLFREVLSGMPEDSRYGLTNTENTYPEAQLYNSQEQAYDAIKHPVDAAYPNPSDPSYSSYSDKQDTSTYEKDKTNYNAAYSPDYSSAYGSSAYGSQDTKYSSDTTNKENSDKYPTYNPKTGTSYVYPETDSSTLEKSSRLNDEYEAEASGGHKYEHYEAAGTAEAADSGSKYGSDKLSAKYSKTKTENMERQPEALYRVASDADVQYRDSTVQGVSSQNSWHRIGSPMDYRHVPHLEPGPRSLDLTKEKKVPKDKHKLTVDEPKRRSKRSPDSVIQRIGRKRSAKSAADSENEVDFDDSINMDDLIKNHQLSTDDVSTTTTSTTEAFESSTQQVSASTTVSWDELFKESPTTTTKTTTDALEPSSTPTEMIEGDKDATSNSSTTSTTTESPFSEDNDDDFDTTPAPFNLMDILKRVAQFKLRLGLNFLRSTTDAFSKYLDDIQKKVDESMSNTTQTFAMRNPWARNLFRRRAKSPLDEVTRKKRSVIEDNEFLGVKLRLGDKSSKRFLRDSTKEPQVTKKQLFSKKKIPKKYHSKRRN